MIGADRINDLIDESIEQLSSDNFNHGVDCLVDLATFFAKAGCSINEFANMRKYIINEAIERTDAYFIKEKIKIAEAKQREVRTGTKIINH